MAMLRDLIYEFILCLLAFIMLPRILYQHFFQGKYRNSFLQRFGLKIPSINKEGRPLVWIHAVSLGETKAVAALGKLIKKQLNNPIIIVSSITETGHNEARRSLPFADFYIYLPLDFTWIIKPIVRRLSPDLVILTETDFWYNFLKSAKECKADIVVVNGKMSIRSLQRFQMLPWFSTELFASVDHFCVQNKAYAERFAQMGVPVSKITVTGNLKFDDESPKFTETELKEWKERLGIKQNNKVLVIGSTHDPEEKLLMNVLENIWLQFPNLKVILVPRHPERFNEVATLLRSFNISFIRFTDINRKTGEEKVILVDAMGILKSCYQLADMAIIGGSYTLKVGGHNIIEPCWYGVPVIFGPHMQTQPELVKLVKDYQAGLQVEEKELTQTLLTCLQDPAKCTSLGQGGLELMADMKGSTVRTWNSISLITH